MNAHQGGIPPEPTLLEIIKNSQSGEAFAEYLNLMEDSEPPRSYMIWSLIAAAASLLGSNAKFQSGPNHKVTPNLFVILLGPSGIRKSTAIRHVRKLMEHTSVNFGPTDSGGQRHGLMSALTGLHRVDNRHDRKPQVDTGPLTPAMMNPRISSDMALFAPELGRLLGTNSQEIASFLLDLYDGATIDYQTKSGETKVWNPLTTLLGATTPSSLASILPDNSAGHGILSRIIFIYDDVRHKDVPIPAEPAEEWYEEYSEYRKRIRWIDANRVDFDFAPNARAYYESVYTYSPHVDDPRLASYRQRRAESLLKIAMNIAALRNDTTIIESDCILSHDLLRLAEPRMHKALEYFGRNKVFAGRMLMLDFLKSGRRSANGPELRAAAASELTTREATDAIESMLASGELIAYGDLFVLGSAKNELNALRARSVEMNKKGTTK